MAKRRNETKKKNNGLSIKERVYRGVSFPECIGRFPECKNYNESDPIEERPECDTCPFKKKTSN